MNIIIILFALIQIPTPDNNNVVVASAAAAAAGGVIKFASA